MSMCVLPLIVCRLGMLGSGVWRDVLKKVLNARQVSGTSSNAFDIKFVWSFWYMCMGKGWRGM